MELKFVEFTTGENSVFPFPNSYIRVTGCGIVKKENDSDAAYIWVYCNDVQSLVCRHKVETVHGHYSSEDNVKYIILRDPSTGSVQTIMWQTDAYRVYIVNDDGKTIDKLQQGFCPCKEDDAHLL